MQLDISFYSPDGTEILQVKSGEISSAQTREEGVLFYTRRTDGGTGTHLTVLTYQQVFKLRDKLNSWLGGALMATPKLWEDRSD